MVTDDCELVIPNAFSPNGDGIGDLWRIKCIEKYPNAHVQIFNRSGNPVFEKQQFGNTQVHGNNDAWWDGRASVRFTLSNDILPAGTYFFVLDTGDGAPPRNGYIFLNR